MTNLKTNQQLEDEATDITDRIFDMLEDHDGLTDEMYEDEGRQEDLWNAIYQIVLATLL